MKKIYLIPVLLLVIANIVHADAANDDPTAAAFTKNVLEPAVDKILMISKATDIDPDIKAKQYSDIISPLFDSDVASRLTLGKERWENLTKNQQDRFKKIYGERLQRFYVNRILLIYPDTDIVFVNTVQQKNRATVTTEMQSRYIKKGFKRDVEYSLIFSGEKWAIYDVTIDGAGILKNFRGQFNPLLKEGTFEDFLNRLETAE